MNTFGALRGKSALSPCPSSTEMLTNAQESRIRPQQEWHDDRKAERALQRRQAQLPGIASSIPSAALVPSRIQCQTCGGYIEAEIRGARCFPKSIYFYPIREKQLVKLATKTSLLEHTILIICGECAARKRSPAMPPPTKGIRVQGLPEHYAVVKPSEWGRFASHTDLKKWLQWRRILCECILFTPSFFLDVLLEWRCASFFLGITKWLCANRSQEEEHPGLHLFATLSTPLAPPSTVQERETLRPSPMSAQLLLLQEQRRLFRPISTPNEDGTPRS